MSTLATNSSLLLDKPACEPGVGALILRPDAPTLIDGVRIQPFPLWPDDRGYFLEVIRGGQGLAADFPLDTLQVSAACNYPGIIKAFHYHLEQTDFWVPSRGMLQIALVDMRVGSPTFGAKNTLYAGELRPWQILIPPGVAHGYKVVSRDPSMLVYVTNRTYNPKDEGRIPYNDPLLAYDWETQHK
ncbi:MAG: dTDP-4-dehydrorhamnose 3,5-epimerase family protein [Bryobacterales bacterium]|jgi:dTDP-4-dehydrorhamnose 3,5-epimerase|nr:dTDP-4-dehydrorhamnose 3,5-epimerase family protein [Bryobacterales bacterium]